MFKIIIRPDVDIGATNVVTKNCEKKKAVAQKSRIVI